MCYSQQCILAFYVVKLPRKMIHVCCTLTSLHIKENISEKFYHKGIKRTAASTKSKSNLLRENVYCT